MSNKLEQIECKLEKKILGFRNMQEKLENFVSKIVLTFCDNSFKQLKVRTIFETECSFKVIPGGFSDLIHWNNSNSNWKKLLRFRNMQENLENVF